MPEVKGRYGAVVCPKCRHAKGVDLGTKTTSCGRCGARHKTDLLRVFFSSDDLEAVHESVGRLEAKVKGRDIGVVTVDELEARLAEGAARRKESARPHADAPDEEVVTFAAAQAAGLASNPKRVDAILDALDEHAGPEGFLVEWVEAAFAAADMDPARADTEIRRCIASDTLYEPRPGRLKRL